MSGGHEAVKAALVDHLTDHLPAWMTVVRGADTWPLDPKLIAASDILPEADGSWPCVLVSSTSMTRKRAVSAVGPGEFLAEYSVTVQTAARAVKERDVDSAAQARDRLVQAVRWLLLASPKLSDDAYALTADLTEETDAVALDEKQRPVAVGRTKFAVRQAETVPDLASYGAADEVGVTVDASDAGHTPVTTGSTHSATVTAT